MFLCEDQEFTGPIELEVGELLQDSRVNYSLIKGIELLRMATCNLGCTLESFGNF